MKALFDTSWYSFCRNIFIYLFALTVKAPVLSETIDYRGCCTWAQHCFRRVLSYFIIHHMMYTVTVDPAIKTGCCYSLWKEAFKPHSHLWAADYTQIFVWVFINFWILSHPPHIEADFFCQIKYNAFKLPSHPPFPYCPPASIFALVQSGQCCLITGLSRSHCEGLEGLDCVIKQASVPPEGHRSRCSH